MTILLSNDRKYRLEKEADNGACVELPDLGTKFCTDRLFDDDQILGQHAHNLTHALADVLYDGDYSKAHAEIHKHNDSTIDNVFEDLNKQFNPKHIYLVPISCYEHDLIDLSTGYSTGWDTSFIGFAIYKPAKGHKDEWGSYDEWLKGLELTLQDATNYYNGEVYTISLYDNLKGQVIDSISGIYPDDNVDEDSDILRNADEYFDQRINYSKDNWHAVDESNMRYSIID